MEKPLFASLAANNLWKSPQFVRSSIVVFFTILNAQPWSCTLDLENILTKKFLTTFFWPSGKKRHKVQFLKLLWCSYLNTIGSFLHSEWSFCDLVRNKTENGLTGNHQFYWCFFGKSPEPLVFQVVWDDKNTTIEKSKITSRKRALPKTLGHNGGFRNLPSHKKQPVPSSKKTPQVFKGERI